MSIVLLSSCSLFGIRNNYEQLKYSIVENFKDIEIRKYNPRLYAEISNAKNRNEAFLTLFKYISGENQKAVSYTHLTLPTICSV